MSGSAKTKVGTRICTEYVNQLKASSFYELDFLPRFNECLKELSDRKIVQLVCYGLGSFYHGVSVAPRYQLALLLLMHEIIAQNGSENLNDTIDIYDPRFKQRDVAILNSFEQPKFHVIEKNELCARKLEATTLVFMPHLHRHLYHNIIGANWQPKNLKQLVLVGNSFRQMIDNTMLSVCKRELYYIHLLVNNCTGTSVKPKLLKWPERNTSDDDIDKQRHKALIEVSIDTPDKDHMFNFNDQAIHFINTEWLSENKDKIKMTRLKKWQPASEFPEDDK
jgi:hypothetical protein